MNFFNDEKDISEIIENGLIFYVIPTKEMIEKIKDLDYGILVSEKIRKVFWNNIIN